MTIALSNSIQKLRNATGSNELNFVSKREKDIILTCACKIQINKAERKSNAANRQKRRRDGEKERKFPEDDCKRGFALVPGADVWLPVSASWLIKELIMLPSMRSFLKYFPFRETVVTKVNKPGKGNESRASRKESGNHYFRWLK